MRIVKYLLAAFGILVLVFGAVIAYVAATFDPNAYKPQLIELVKDKTQRTLKLDGAIQLAFWPSIGAELGKLSLSEPRSEVQFAAVEGLRVSLKLLPLLSREVVVNEVVVKGARINLVREKKGRLNIADLTDAAEAGDAKSRISAPTGGSAPPKLDIDHIVLTDATLNFRDEQAGAQYAISKLNLKTGRIAEGVPADIAVSLAAKADKPKLDITLDSKLRLTFDLKKEAYAAEKLTFDLRGRAADISDLQVKAGGNAAFDLRAGAFATEGLAVTASGKQGASTFKIKLDAPKVTLKGDKAGGDMVFELESQQGDQGIKAKIASPIAGNVTARQISLPQLKAEITLTGPQLPGKSASGVLAGALDVDLIREAVRTRLAGKVLDSNIKLNATMAGFSPLAPHIDLELDQLDVDKYLPSKSAASGSAGSGSASAGANQSAAAGSEKPFDLTGLRALNASGSLVVGNLKVDNLKVSQLRLQFKADKGRVEINPLSAQLYQGGMAGALTVNAAPAVPTFSVRQKLAGVQIGPLLKDLADKDLLEGRAEVNLDVHTQGNTVSALKRALGGNAALKVNDGALRGIDIAAALRSAKDMIDRAKGEHTQQSDTKQKTDFSELSASFAISQGVARNKDLSMKSPLLRVGGEGEVNIGAGTIDYLVKASLVATSTGQDGKDLGAVRSVTVPIRVTGPLAAPSYKLDFGAMLTDAAKQKIESAVKDKLRDKLLGGSGSGAASGEPAKDGGARDKLKGLFGR
ncbi:MAG: AsmA family protein [Burkholderiales bacterium]|jgi:AsmA protein|nr:AsmA family protein [Burkholderiales bacterium]